MQARPPPCHHSLHTHRTLAPHTHWHPQDLACAKVASFLKGRTTVEIRKVLGIKSDYVRQRQPARARCCHAPPPYPRPFPPPHTHARHAQTKAEEEAVREENKWCEEAP